METKKKLEDFIFSLLFASVPLILLVGLFALSTTGLASPMVDVELELEETDNILQTIEDNLPGNPPSQVLDQISTAIDMQGDAYSAFGRGEAMLALHMTMQAREMGRRAESMISQLISSEPELPDILLRLLESNAELIEELSPSVDEYGGQVSRSNFAAAVDMQNEAWMAFENGDYEIASKLASVVQDKLSQVRKAISIQENRYDTEYVSAEIERASELLNRAEEKVPEGAVESMDLLRTAQDMFVETEALFAQGRSNEASRMLEEVITITQRAVKISEKRSLRSAELLETLSRTDDFLETAHSEAEESGRGDAMDIMERAMDIQIEAKHALNSSDNPTAEKLTLEARRLAELAIRTAQDNGEIEPDKVQKALLKTDDMIATIGPDIENSGNEAAVKLLRRAEQLQAEALAYFDQNNLREALTMTRAASETAQRAARMAGLE